MSKGLRNMSKKDRQETVRRRLSNDSDKVPKGLGYLAAKDYKNNPKAKAQDSE